jgi:osmotically-inducible protein OsmY
VESDHATTIRVESELQRATVYKFPSVHVDTLNGVVQLNGFVATPDQKRAAVQMAQSVPGVSRVIDHLEIQPEAPAPTGRSSQGTAPVISNSNQTPSNPK